MEIGNKIQFVDKTGEVLKGTITNLEYDGNPEIIRAECFKKSWNMTIGCLVTKRSVTVLKNK